jgi:outer membrane protein, adhesin transport system
LKKTCISYALLLTAWAGVVHSTPVVDAQVDPSGPETPFSLTFRELQDAARTTHPGIQSSRLQQQAAQQDVTVAERQRWPQLSAVVESHSNSVGSELMQVLRVNQTLWDGGYLSARVETARAQEASSEESVQVELQGVDLQLVDAWHKLRTAIERQRIAQATLEKLRGYQLQMQRRIRAQASPQIDLELVNARALQTEVDLVGAQELMHMAVSQLEQLSGLTDLNQRMTHLPPLPDAAQIQSFSRLLDQTDWRSTVDVHASVQRARHEWEMAQHQLEAKRAEQWPQAYVRVDQPLIKSSDLYGTTEPRLFLGMQYTPGAGFANLIEAQAMATRMQSQEQRIEAARREVVQTLNSDVDSFTSARHRWQALEKSEQGSAQVLASYTRQFQAGRKSWQDVLNALREQAQNQYSQVEARVAMSAAMYRLSVRLKLALAPEPERVSND